MMNTPSGNDGGSKKNDGSPGPPSQSSTDSLLVALRATALAVRTIKQVSFNGQPKERELTSRRDEIASMMSMNYQNVLWLLGFRELGAV